MTESGELIGGQPAVVDVPDGVTAVLVLAHGAGAGMRHHWMAAVASAIVARGVGVVRFDFPWMAAGKARPDSPAVATAAIRAVVAATRARWPGLALLAGGKSFGGRMTTTTLADGGLPSVRGAVLLGFPLHPAGAPSSTRAAHLAQVPVPMLFVHGDRDALAEPTLMAPVLAGLGARATVHVLPGADHGFAIRKRDGGDAHVLGEIADAVAAFARACAPTA